MAFGAQFFNDHGEGILGDFDVIFEAMSGLGIKNSSLFGSLLRFYGLQQWAATSARQVSSASNSLRVYDPLWGDSDLAFWQVGSSGFFWSMGCDFPSTANAGVNFGIMSTSSARLPWKVGTPDKSASVSGSYGLQVRDASGSVTFDSRRKQIGIVDHILFTKAQADSVLINNAVIDVTLSESVPGAYICAPQWNSYRHGTTSNSAFYLINVSQISNTKIRFKRETRNLSHFNNNAGPPQTPYISYVHDAVLLVAAA